MKEINMNLWTEVDSYTNIRCILTNGFVKQNGQLVMGKGIAKEAAEKYIWLSKRLGSLVKEEGNNVYFFDHSNIISFPTKHNFWEKSDIDLIVKSCYQLVDLIEYYKTCRLNKIKYVENIYLPRPGCGNGGLIWEIEVKPIIEPILDNSLIPITIVYN